MPPPPAPPAAAAHPGTPPPPPPGYAGPPPHLAGHGTNVRVGGTGGLRKATIVLFFVSVGAMALLWLMLLNRRSVWEDLAGGELDLGGISDLEDADAAVGGIAFLVFLIALATTIVLSIWSLRVARRATVGGARDVSPGLACGGWYIPFANVIVPFVQLRRVARHEGRGTVNVGIWQGLAIATWVLSVILQVTGDTDVDSIDDLSGRLTAQVVVGGLMVVVLLAMAIVATRAMRDIDAA